MDDLSYKKLKETKNTLDKINNQRRKWLYASSVVFFSIVAIIFLWDWLDNRAENKIWWVIVSLMLIVSVNWWYWTVRVLLKLIEQRKSEIIIINELIFDIRDIKSSISELNNEIKKNSK
jgi:hypothetical protein